MSKPGITAGPDDNPWFTDTWQGAEGWPKQPFAEHAGIEAKLTDDPSTSAQLRLRQRAK